MARRKRKKPWFRRLFKAAAFAAVAAIFSIGCCLKVQSLHGDERALDVQIQELETQIEEEKERQLDERVLKEYYASDAYKEKIAREKFNLIYPGEKLYVVN